MANKKIVGLLVGSKRRLTGVAVLVLLVAGGAGYFIYHRTNSASNATPVHIPTEQQAITNELAKLKAHPPADNANPAQQSDYYKRLTSDLADSGDYKGAIAAFAKHEAVNPKSLDYFAYLKLAYYNSKIGDKTAVNAAIDKALTLVPKQDDPSVGYVYSDEVQSINNLRAEYNQ